MAVRFCVVLVFTASLTCGLGAQGDTPNPRYTSWAKVPKGTEVTTVLTTVDTLGKTTVVTQTLTLLEVHTDNVVVGVVSVSEVTGAVPFKTRQKNQEIPKSSVGLKSLDPRGTVEVGKALETVKTSAGEYKARWYKTVIEPDGSKIEGKTWLSDDVPGRFVKAESVTTVGGKVKYRTAEELVDVRRP